VTSWSLYLRSHGLFPTLAGVAVVATCDRALGAVVFNVGNREPVGVQLTAVVPAALAAVLVVSSDGRARMVDVLAARPLGRQRLALDAGLLVVSLAALAAASPGGGSAEVATAAGLRNLIGLVGIGWLASVVVGAELAWVPGTLLILVAMIVGRRDTAVTSLWSWILSSDGNRTAWLTAVLLGLAGAAARHRTVGLVCRVRLRPWGLSSIERSMFWTRSRPSSSS
jgi:hypothetical protein